ncbi:MULTISPECIES: hypothetical protein [Xanthobacter]|uniref:hypothetical protein n=1 Tax=Xanthobacter TaxID=279 RepID=UPI001F3B065F|nr:MULTISPECIES: hypothetical protein [unclassified Xanthobacter]
MLSFRSAAIAALMVCAVAAPAAAKNRKVDIINKTGHTMTSFFASNVDEESWEEDMLDGDTLKNGETLEADINDGTGACIFDFKAVFADGDSVVKRKVDVCKVGEFTFLP